MSTCRGGCLAGLSASSTSDLYSTVLPMRLPPAAVIISAGFASSMRAARLAAAKPPNTTEWTAPRRAQATIAKQASGIIGREKTNRSPHFPPEDLPIHRALTAPPTPTYQTPFLLSPPP